MTLRNVRIEDALSAPRLYHGTRLTVRARPPLRALASSAAPRPQLMPHTTIARRTPHAARRTPPVPPTPTPPLDAASPPAGPRAQRDCRSRLRRAVAARPTARLALHRRALPRPLRRPDRARPRPLLRQRFLRRTRRRLRRVHGAPSAAPAAAARLPAERAAARTAARAARAAAPAAAPATQPGLPSRLRLPGRRVSTVMHLRHATEKVGDLRQQCAWLHWRILVSLFV